MKSVNIMNGKYRVSTDGKIWSYHYKRYLSGSLCVGYWYHRLDHKNYRTHRILALAFIPNPHNKPQINHKDGNKLNNRISNLEWATAKENVAHALRTGLAKSKKGIPNPELKERHRRNRLIIGRRRVKHINSLLEAGIDKETIYYATGIKV